MATTPVPGRHHGVVTASSLPTSPRAARLAGLWLWGLLALLCLGPQALSASSAWRGVPVSRFYSFDEIGRVSSGVIPSVDRHGRLTLTKNGACYVLNDEQWVATLSPGEAEPRVSYSYRDARGNAYYGGVGTWGALGETAEGGLRPSNWCPPEAPSWAAAMNVNRIACSSQAVCFGGWQGVVVHPKSSQPAFFLPVDGLSTVFDYADTLYVSSHTAGVRAIDVSNGRFLEPGDNPFASRKVDVFAPVGPDHAFFSTTDRRLWSVRGTEVAPFTGELPQNVGGRISALVRIPDGPVAVAVTGVGLHLLSTEGRLLTTLKGPEYRDVRHLVSPEPGVLWLVTQSGLIKMLTGAPLTCFSPGNGLPVYWPQFVRLGERLLVASNGKLYEAGPASTVEPAQFSLVPVQPKSGCWGLAVHEGDLLVGNRDGVFMRRAGADFETVLGNFDVARLIMLGSGVCLAVGTNHMTALKRDSDGRWRECCPRIAGVGYPSIAHAGAHAAWLELGANLVARVSLVDGRLQSTVFRDFPWKDARWIHVSILGDTVVLSGPEGGRLYYDETSGQVSEHSVWEPQLARLGPDWPARLHLGEGKVLVASHARGVSVYHLRDGTWREHANHWGVGECYVPQIQCLDDGTVFLSTGSEVYTLDLSVEAPASRFSPKLVTAVNQLSGLGLDGSSGELHVEGHPTLRSGVALRFFSGSQASRRAPVYEVSRDGEVWERLSGSQLDLGNLSSGRHEIRVRLLDRQVPVGQPKSFFLFVPPHWSRTWQAWVLYALVLCGLLLLGARLLLARARKRATRLRQLVLEKNEALESAMEQLAQESRMSATLAERNRLAAEIHDTLEQSLSALALQLATTATHPGCPERVRAGLALAGNMVVFSRDEVRSVVWDLETPGVGEGGLRAALQRLLDQSLPGEVVRRLVIEGEFVVLPPQLEHHLLRIAQEAVANIVKHAAARSVELRLCFAPGQVELAVRDDGRGFEHDEAAPAPMNHFGLRFLRGRAAKIGGTLRIQSRPGEGTLVAITVPLTAPSAP